MLFSQCFDFLCCERVKSLAVVDRDRPFLHFRLPHCERSNEIAGNFRVYLRRVRTTGRITLIDRARRYAVPVTLEVAVLSIGAHRLRTRSPNNGERRQRKSPRTPDPLVVEKALFRQVLIEYPL